MRLPSRRLPLGLVLVLAAASLRTAAAAGDSRRHVIYVHGRIVQQEQSARPKSPQYGYYELEKIRAAFRDAGFELTSEIRPKEATVSDSADRITAQVRKLLASGVPADRITVVGASMGASITLLASVRLQNPDVRYVVLGACLEGNVRELEKEEGGAPSGHMLAIREKNDDTGPPCTAWSDAGRPRGMPVAREIVLDTGLSHGFLYTPMPEWVLPTLAWAAGREAAAREEDR